MSHDPAEVALRLGCVAMCVAYVVAWFTHIVICIDSDRWGMLIVGALLFPVAVIHGVGHWFHVW